jgi:hypothetical protein
MTMTRTPIAQAIARKPLWMRFQAQRTIPNICAMRKMRPSTNSPSEFLEKLRYLYAQQAKIWDLPDNGDDYGCIVIAAACHFCPVNA